MTWPEYDTWLLQNGFVQTRGDIHYFNSGYWYPALPEPLSEPATGVWIHVQRDRESQSVFIDTSDQKSVYAEDPKRAQEATEQALMSYDTGFAGFGAVYPRTGDSRIGRPVKGWFGAGRVYSATSRSKYLIIEREDNGNLVTVQEEEVEYTDSKASLDGFEPPPTFEPELRLEGYGARAPRPKPSREIVAWLLGQGFTKTPGYERLTTTEWKKRLHQGQINNAWITVSFSEIGTGSWSVSLGVNAQKMLGHDESRVRETVEQALVWEDQLLVPWTDEHRTLERDDPTEYKRRFGALIHERWGNDEREAKVCSCGRVYSTAEWEELQLIGQQHVEADEEGPAFTLEMRNCGVCNTTLAVDVPT